MYCDLSDEQVVLFAGPRSTYDGTCRHFLLGDVVVVCMDPPSAARL